MNLVHKIQLISLVLLICLIAAAPALADAATADTQVASGLAAELPDSVNVQSENPRTDSEYPERETELNAVSEPKDPEDDTLQKAENGAEGEGESHVIAEDTDAKSASNIDCEVIEDTETDAGTESAAETEKETTIKNDEGLTLVSVGCGDLFVDKDGRVSCVPEKGYEIISITADKDADDVKKGNQIPETEIAEISFDEDTTITAIFRKTPEDELFGIRPVSATSIFGNGTDCKQN